jgi:2-keto-4-pentenoate hydratase/2-oxohepta-3-ene-1,7-dioic acid hydratase in catechol pathway
MVPRRVYMQLVSYEGGFGRLENDKVIPLGQDIMEFLQTGIVNSNNNGERLPLAGLRLLAPVRKPGKIICVGLNYRDHAAETGLALPDDPPLFCKFANSVADPGVTVKVPRVVTSLDYEAELGVVIGRTARDVSVADALDYVAGYVCANDVSARELQFRTTQWTAGKAIDEFLPMGPILITSDELGDPQQLPIRCWVNGELRQDGSTADMIFGVAELIAYVTRTMTLEPGDVLVTGTPGGVGMSSSPPRYLSEGDEVSVEIGALGRLSNRFSWQ